MGAGARLLQAMRRAARREGTGEISGTEGMPGGEAFPVYNRREVPTPSEGGPQALPEPAEDYLRWLWVEKGARPHTVASYRGDLDFFERYLNSRSLTLARPDGISPQNIKGFLAEQHRVRHARSSMARRLSCLRGFFKHMMRKGLVHKDPCYGIKAPRLPKAPPRALNVDQTFALLDAPRSPGDPEAARDKALAETLYGAGVRISEALGLQLSDVDLASRYVRVLGKGAKERFAPLSDTAVEALRAYLAVRHALNPDPAEQTVFLGQRGKPLQRAQANRILHALSLRAGLPATVSAHVMRHSFASHMLQSGADIREVQELLGHERLSTTQRYTSLDLARITQAYDKAHPRAKGTPKVE